MKTRILIVDDEKDFVKTLSERLTIRDYDVTESYSGEDALDKIRCLRDLDELYRFDNLSHKGYEDSIFLIPQPEHNKIFFPVVFHKVFFRLPSYGFQHIKKIIP